MEALYNAIVSNDLEEFKVLYPRRSNIKFDMDELNFMDPELLVREKGDCISLAVLHKADKILNYLMVNKFGKLVPKTLFAAIYVDFGSANANGEVFDNDDYEESPKYKFIRNFFCELFSYCGPHLVTKIVNNYIIKRIDVLKQTIFQYSPSPLFICLINRYNVTAKNIKEIALCCRKFSHAVDVVLSSESDYDLGKILFNIRESFPEFDSEDDQSLCDVVEEFGLSMPKAKKEKKVKVVEEVVAEEVIVEEVVAEEVVAEEVVVEEVVAEEVVAEEVVAEEVVAEEVVAEDVVVEEVVAEDVVAEDVVAEDVVAEEVVEEVVAEQVVVEAKEVVMASEVVMAKEVVMASEVVMAKEVVMAEVVVVSEINDFSTYKKVVQHCKDNKIKGYSKYRTKAGLIEYIRTYKDKTEEYKGVAEIPLEEKNAKIYTYDYLGKCKKCKYVRSITDRKICHDCNNDESVNNDDCGICGEVGLVRGWKHTSCPGDDPGRCSGCRNRVKNIDVNGGCCYDCAH
jgi:hypothetical protein